MVPLRRQGIIELTKKFLIKLLFGLYFALCIRRTSKRKQILVFCYLLCSLQNVKLNIWLPANFLGRKICFFPKYSTSLQSLCLVEFCVISCIGQRPISVTTTQGEVRGRGVVMNRQEYGVFLRIPFAEAPIGQLRFQVQRALIVVKKLFNKNSKLWDSLKSLFLSGKVLSWQNKVHFLYPDSGE